MLPQELIRLKRDNATLTAADIETFVGGITDHSIGDAQIAAFAMAVFFNDLSMDERVALTCAMRDSGRVLSWQDLGRPVVDKHSTGGVGDTVSLILASLVAACGAAVPMISGRGLGHTGGTLDKLAAIPGYDATPSLELFRRTVRTVGCAIVGQSGDLAPADARIYATRDVTATVESIALITASILSKKLAAGLDALVMDVKVGAGAFMPTMAKARELAASIASVGRGAGLATTALLTPMDQPLAPCAGNAVEVRCAIDVLTGASGCGSTDAIAGRGSPARGNERLVEVSLALGAAMLVSAGLAPDDVAARRKLTDALRSGHAAERFARMVAALGGPSDLLEAADRHLPLASCRRVVRAPSDGIVRAIDVRALGLAVVALGGGRRQASDAVDPAVGLADFAALGQGVAAGDALATVYARTDDDAARAAATVLASVRLDERGDADAAPLPPVVERID